MRVLFIAPSAYLIGGVQDWLYMLVMGLRERGHQITVGVPDGEFHRLDPYNKNYTGLNAKGFANTTGTDAGRRRALAKFLSDNPADLVVGVNIGTLYEAFAEICNKLPPTRLAIAIHAIETDYFSDIQAYATLLDGVITPSRLTEAMLKAMQAVPEHRIFYAPCGVEQGPIRIPTNATMLRIAWAGRIEDSQKRASDLRSILVELDKAHCDYRLSIAGVGPRLDTLKSQLAPWVQADKVIFEGFIEKHSMAEFLARNDIFLITSEWETGPIVAWEAMAAGLVIVSSRYVGAILEKALIHNSTALLFPIGNSEEACRQIQRLKSRTLREKLSTQGRQMSLERYSRQASISAWESAFETILQLEQRPRQPIDDRRSTSATGRLERLFGQRLAERLRMILPLKTYIPNPGSEWPHAIHHHSDQSTILKEARAIEALSDPANLSN